MTFDHKVNKKPLQNCIRWKACSRRNRLPRTLWIFLEND